MGLRTGFQQSLCHHARIRHAEGGALSADVRVFVPGQVPDGTWMLNRILRVANRGLGKYELGRIIMGVR
jgi:hypothetical protein